VSPAYAARAMETLCFCPPLRLIPLSPISTHHHQQQQQHHQQPKHHQQQQQH